MSDTASSRKESVAFADESTDSSVSLNTRKSISGPNLKIMGSVGKRKPSYAKLALSSLESIRARRTTRAVLTDLPEVKVEEKPKIKLENTYKMVPDENTKFSTSKVKKEVYKVFEYYLGDVKYDPIRCSKMCLDLSVLIKDKVKSLDFPRYKIVCNVIIGQCRDQGLEAVSRSIWDAKNDNFAYVIYKNTSLFAIGVVHGIYYE